MPKTHYKYPANVEDIKTTIQFTCRRDITNGNKSTDVLFPCPQNLTFNNVAQYDNIDLGLIGTSLIKNNFNIGNTARDIGSQLTSEENTSANIIQAIRRLSTDSAVTRAADISQGKVLNPNKNSAFSGIEPRVFQFTFKLVPESEKEAQEISNIKNFFMVNTYPDSNDDLYLNYPSTWNINFLYGGVTNENIPKIFESYLTDCSITMNESTNIWHKGGYAAETSIALTFRETKTIKARDIA